MHSNTSYHLILCLIRIVDTTVSNNVSGFALRTICLPYQHPNHTYTPRKTYQANPGFLLHVPLHVLYAEVPVSSKRALEYGRQQACDHRHRQRPWRLDRSGLGWSGRFVNLGFGVGREMQTIRTQTLNSADWSA